jgi:release factor glutamine methyltransferase
MASVGELLRHGARCLRQAGVPDAGRDARLLMAAALGLPPARLTLAEPDPAGAGTAARFAAHIDARAMHQPVAQILGRRAFWGREFEVTRHVLDPRPETETLVELALAGPAPRRILDLGTGSGALLVTLLAEWPGASGLGIDASAEALKVGARNAARHGVEARAEFRPGDWCEGIVGRHDLVVCNPPYIPADVIAGLAPSVRDWEPRDALTPGPTGLESYARIAAGLRDVLAPGGRALFEIGADQGSSVPALFRTAGFPAPLLHRDLAGRPRCVDISS